MCVICESWPLAHIFLSAFSVNNAAMDLETAMTTTVTKAEAVREIRLHDQDVDDFFAATKIKPTPRDGLLRVGSDGVTYWYST